MKLPHATPPDPVVYLVDQRFPGHSWSLRFAPPSLANPRGSTQPKPAPTPDEVLDAEKYEAELRLLPSEQLQALVDAAKKAEWDGYAAAAAREEAARFFNLPYAGVEPVYWAKQAYWTIDEAVALSFGKDPRVVTWAKINPFVEVSNFARWFRDRRDMFGRAVTMGQLYAHTVPTIFLAWAKRMDVAVPPELAAEFARLGLQIADWKSLFDDHDKSLAETRALVVSLTGELAQARAELARGQTMPTIAPTPVPATQHDVRELGTRERETLLKIVLGMAIKGYSYDPAAGKSLTAKEIADDLALVGIPVSDDTVRKRLKEASDLLPGKTE